MNSTRLIDKCLAIELDRGSECGVWLGKRGLSGPPPFLVSSDGGSGEGECGGDEEREEGESGDHGADGRGGDGNSMLGLGLLMEGGKRSLHGVAWSGSANVCLSHL